MENLRLLENLFWIVAFIAAVFGLYYLAKWLKSLYDAFTSPGGSTEANIVNMFTEHNADGSVDPKNVAPKGTDPVDWLFMNHEDPT